MRVPQFGNNARSRRDAIARLHSDLPFGSQHYVDARAEFDEAHALGRIENVAGPFVTDDPARDQSGDLLENYLSAPAADDAFHRDHVLLIGLAGFFFTGYQELALLVSDARDFSRDGRAVHVHVEDVEKDTDAAGARGVGLDGDHLAVGG